MTSYPPFPPPNGLSFTAKTHQAPYPFISNPNNKSNNKGQAVLITGGRTGPGRAAAIALAASGAARIAVADPSNDFDKLAHDIIQAADARGHPPPQIVLTVLDVTDQASVEKCAALIGEEFKGRLDVLVYGGNGGDGAGDVMATLEEADFGEWWRGVEVGAKGLALVGKYFLPLLLASKGGSQTMVNMSSSADALDLRPGASAQGVAGMAMVKLTEFLLVEAAERGLVAYSVSTGAAAQTDQAGDGLPVENLGEVTDEVELAGQTVAWLVGERREWLAGRYLCACWDMEEVTERREEIFEGDKLKVRLVV